MRRAINGRTTNINTYVFGRDGLERFEFFA